MPDKNLYRFNPILNDFYLIIFPQPFTFIPIYFGPSHSSTWSTTHYSPTPMGPTNTDKPAFQNEKLTPWNIARLLVLYWREIRSRERRAVLLDTIPLVLQPDKNLYIYIHILSHQLMSCATHQLMSCAKTNQGWIKLSLGSFWSFPCTQYRSKCSIFNMISSLRGFVSVLNKL